MDALLTTGALLPGPFTLDFPQQVSLWPLPKNSPCLFLAKLSLVLRVSHKTLRNVGGMFSTLAPVFGLLHVGRDKDPRVHPPEDLLIQKANDQLSDPSDSPAEVQVTWGRDAGHPAWSSPEQVAGRTD